MQRREEGQVSVLILGLFVIAHLCLGQLGGRGTPRGAASA